MKKYLVFVIVLGLFVFGAFKVHAVTLEDLQKQIQILSEQVSSLSSQLKGQLISTSATFNKTAPATLNTSSEEILKLQSTTNTSSAVPAVKTVPDSSVNDDRPTTLPSATTGDSVSNAGVSTINSLVGFFTRTLKKGMSGNDVKLLQSFLGIEKNGKFDLLTEASLKIWQTSKKLKVDGVFGKNSLASMIVDFNKNSSNNTRYNPTALDVPTGNTECQIMCFWYGFDAYHDCLKVTPGNTQACDIYAHSVEDDCLRTDCSGASAIPKPNI